MNFKVYNHPKGNYTINYPESWVVKNSNDIVSIESKDFRGGIYISLHNGITLPDENMKTFIIESNNLNSEFEKNIFSGTEHGVRSWYISYTDTENNLICMAAYKRRGTAMLFVSAEIEPGLWKNGWKELIVEIISSIVLT